MELIGIAAKDIFSIEGSLRYIRKFYNFPSVWFLLYWDVVFKCIA